MFLRQNGPCVNNTIMRVVQGTDRWDTIGGSFVDPVPPALRIFRSHGRGDGRPELKYRVHRGPNCGDHGKCTITTLPVLDQFGDEVDHRTEVGCVCESDAYTSSYDDVYPTEGCNLYDRCFGVECGRGSCHHGHCVCIDGYTGTNCEVRMPRRRSCGSVVPA